MKSVVLFLAQGFGSGRIPFGPGTFGSIIGLLWFFVLLFPGSALMFVLGIILSIPVSVWACGEAEKILGKADPGSVVLDEIVAIPLCFASWLTTLHFTRGIWPGAEYFYSRWPMVFAVFIFFRIFDIAKPWPIRQSQSMHGGWGVTLDDLLAAIYVNAAMLLFWWQKPQWF